MPRRDRRIWDYARHNGVPAAAEHFNIPEIEVEESIKAYKADKLGQDINFRVSRGMRPNPEVLESQNLLKWAEKLARPGVMSEDDRIRFMGQVAPALIQEIFEIRRLKAAPRKVDHWAPSLEGVVIENRKTGGD